MDTLDKILSFVTKTVQKITKYKQDVEMETPGIYKCMQCMINSKEKNDFMSAYETIKMFCMTSKVYLC